LPSLRKETLPVRRGDVLLLATDGVDRSFADWPDLVGSPQDIADRILARYGREDDDALVLAARVLEAEA
jgi:hypothetical protein